MAFQGSRQGRGYFGQIGELLSCRLEVAGACTGTGAKVEGVRAAFFGQAMNNAASKSIDRPAPSFQDRIGKPRPGVTAGPRRPRASGGTMG
jgi:hypothetical protein